MRETRLSGSEGGGAEGLSLPLSDCCHTFPRIREMRVCRAKALTILKNERSLPR